MFTPESMAVARVQLWIHGMDGVGDGAIRRGGGERLGKGGPIAGSRETYIQRSETGIVVNSDYRFHGRVSIDVNVASARPALPSANRTPAPSEHSQRGNCTEADPFLFGNKPRPDPVGRAILQAVPLLRICYSVDQDGQTWGGWSVLDAGILIQTAVRDQGPAHAWWREERMQMGVLYLYTRTGCLLRPGWKIGWLCECVRSSGSESGARLTATEIREFSFEGGRA
jgi:hypothetical protein